MSDTIPTITTHIARMAMNNDPEIRAWVEQWLKNREREKYLAGGASEDSFDNHWLYVKPETMHEGAVEAYTAYVEQLN